jgi:hypothetical protein
MYAGGKWWKCIAKRCIDLKKGASFIGPTSTSMYLPLLCIPKEKPCLAKKRFNLYPFLNHKRGIEIQFDLGGEKYHGISMHKVVLAIQNSGCIFLTSTKSKYI